MNIVARSMTKIFGSRNDRLLKKYRRIVEEINEAEAAARSKTDLQLRQRTQELRKQVVNGDVEIDDIVPEAMAIIRESMDRNIGIREIFNPDRDFDPNRLDDHHLELYDSVQRHMIATGMSYNAVEIPHELYEAVRKLYPESRPPFRARCFDVQLIGGIVLSEGKIAEMKTGEGKTFVAPLAAFLRALRGQHTHVVTVNDYLVSRDATWVRPAFNALGLSVGFLQAQLPPGGQQRKMAYACDVTYGTNSEFGFDYLRDNMKPRVDQQVQGPLDFAIIDEVDSILIDEARTPLIISGLAHAQRPDYGKADEVARHILDLARPWQKAQDDIDDCKKIIKSAEGELDKASGKDAKRAAEERLKKAQQKLAAAEQKQTEHVQYYELEADKKQCHLTHEGIAAAQEKAGVGSFYVGGNMDWPHLMEQAMRAHVVYEKDKEYVVEPDPKNGRMSVIIVDEYTGRKMVGRQWSDGLHQAVEAKEGVEIKDETQTLATITLQNFFKLYKALAGMTGTAQTEAEEFDKIYNLDVVSIPTNRPVIRADHTDLVYRTVEEKLEALLDDIKSNSDAGRPVLVGTASVESSEMLSHVLKRKHGIQHEVLNAKQHEREGHIVAHAGEQHTDSRGKVVGNVTIATNMAGRGTDIKPAQETFFEVQSIDNDSATLKQRGTDKTFSLTPEDEGWRVFNLDRADEGDLVGGLHVIGSERHTARRIDDQLRGRSGRQGDPGSSRFYVSLADPLMKMFMPDWAVNVLKRAGLQYGEPIESGLVTKQIAGAQKKVEERNYLSRKNLLEYDEIMDLQRLQFYGLRQRVLEGRDIDRVIWEMIGESIEDAVDKYVAADYRATVLAEYGRETFGNQVDVEDLRGLRTFQDVDDLLKQKAKDEVSDTIRSTLGEFMGEDRFDSSAWDTGSIVNFAQTNYGVTLTHKQVKDTDSEDLAELLIEAAYKKVDKTDTSGVNPLLEPLFPLEELCKWANSKFSIGLNPDELLQDKTRNISKPPAEIIQMIDERGRAAYLKREIEYPIDHVLGLAQQQGEVIENPQVASYLSAWVKLKYAMNMPAGEIVGKRVRELRDPLMDEQEAFLGGQKIKATVEQIIAAGGDDPQKLAGAFNARFDLPTFGRSSVGQTLPPAMNAGELDPVRLAESKKGVKERDRNADGVIDQKDVLLRKTRYMIRRELTDLEQFVLIQILDSAWKDHLYAMDMLRGGISLQAFAEVDPRIAFKREGYRYFRTMMEGVRDRVTNLIFHLRVDGGNVQTAPQPQQDSYQETAAVHAEVDDSPEAAARGLAGGDVEAESPSVDEDDGDSSSGKGDGKRQKPKQRNQKGRKK